MRDRDRTRIVELYRTGMSSREVAAEVRLARSTVLRVLKEADVDVRPQGVRYDQHGHKHH